MIVKKCLNIGILIMILLLLVEPAQAWGVNYSSLKYQMSPGETRYIEFYLENYFSEETMHVSVGIDGDHEIVELNTDSHTLPGGTRNYIIPLKISVPEEANGRYSFDVVFQSQASTEEFERTSRKKVNVEISTTERTISNEEILESEKITSTPTGLFLLDSGNNLINIILKFLRNILK